MGQSVSVQSLQSPAKATAQPASSSSQVSQAEQQPSQSPQDSAGAAPTAENGDATKSKKKKKKKGDGVNKKGKKKGKKGKKNKKAGANGDLPDATGTDGGDHVIEMNGVDHRGSVMEQSAGALQVDADMHMAGDHEYEHRTSDIFAHDDQFNHRTHEDDLNSIDHEINMVQPPTPSQNSAHSNSNQPRRFEQAPSYDGKAEKLEGFRITNLSRSALALAAKNEDRDREASVMTQPQKTAATSPDGKESDPSTKTDKEADADIDDGVTKPHKNKVTKYCKPIGLLVVVGLVIALIVFLTV